MEKIILMFGGRSVEHEVSILSARNILDALQPNYEVILIGMSRSGVFYMIEEYDILYNIKEIDDHLSRKICTFLRYNRKCVIFTENCEKFDFDLVFNIIHGSLGEDGALQGMFEVMHVPYVGAGILASAIGMSKLLFKNLAKSYGLPIAEFLSTSHPNEISYSEAKVQLGSEIMFVKSENLGSSVGVERISNEVEYIAAVVNALKYSRKVIIEKAIFGRELECAVLGNIKPIASGIGEIKPRKGCFYSYESKYLDTEGVELILEAELPDEIKCQARELAIKAFTISGCVGMARVDMFLSIDNELFLNEINTIPGFTNISMYPQLWEKVGIDNKTLIKRLIMLAKEEFAAKDLLSLDRTLCCYYQ